jgi:hypothetical protein
MINLQEMIEENEKFRQFGIGGRFILQGGIKYSRVNVRKSDPLLSFFSA